MRETEKPTVSTHLYKGYMIQKYGCAGSSPECEVFEIPFPMETGYIGSENYNKQDIYKQHFYKLSYVLSQYPVKYL